LTRLRSKTQKLQADLDQLHAILDELSKSYNPNYQDMAVKAAVVGYEELTKISEVVEGETVDEEPEEDIGDGELDELERKDLEALLLSEDADVSVENSDDEGGLRELPIFVHRYNS
jgi:protein kinase C substrate 80K-H